MNEQRLVNIEKKQDEMAQDIVEIKTDITGLNSDVKGIHKTLEHHSDLLCFVIKKMDENVEENRRWFGVLLEKSQDEMKAMAEGFRASRDRLDDHEERIGRLEAS